jgi:EAL domain-containing protein (putative c-di-GMP-specific phosphodiesterase class I)
LAVATKEFLGNMTETAFIQLKYALDAGQIIPYFQPLTNLLTDEVYGFEVLSRWHHPTHGILMPDDFIPLAEAGDLIGDLTENVVTAAAKSAAQWPTSLKLSINVSPLELRDWSLPERLQAAVERGGLPMSRIVLEISESALIGNLELARSIADDLKRSGARLALDDFGTGYSSLHHLQALPFDEIKVDASFVGSMNRRRESRKIVAAVVALGSSLGLTSVAEGIEEQSQADMLVGLGCEHGQGWLFGRPTCAEEVAKQISKQQLQAQTAATSEDRRDRYAS